MASVFTSPFLSPLLFYLWDPLFKKDKKRENWFFFGFFFLLYPHPPPHHTNEHTKQSVRDAGWTVDEFISLALSFPRASTQELSGDTAGDPEEQGFLSSFPSRVGGGGAKLPPGAIIV
jgi:hypothetical protein